MTGEFSKDTQEKHSADRASEEQTHFSLVTGVNLLSTKDLMSISGILYDKASLPWVWKIVFYIINCKVPSEWLIAVSLAQPYLSKLQCFYNALHGMHQLRKEIMCACNKGEYATVRNLSCKILSKCV